MSTASTSQCRASGSSTRERSSRAEAEDAVQDTFLRWQAVDAGSLASPGAWLTTVCTRRGAPPTCCVPRIAAGSRTDVRGEDSLHSVAPEPSRHAF
ncbi:hypothetical protein KEU06_28520 [Pseudaminobacter sp. 19-2017]|uniref:RNA polymerase sigma-70 region 2 domain-containing protein n=1 Tax=Pseudaminobacter soli (ex Zhang et al. 2022) TaxID=2831468 RepID=A0A942E2C6_9HYPH|nr:hypothetical protein [Pseudaminobacter soli]